ncbi:MAG: beta-propeller fold lactonase family protein [Candidatus Tectomicrobia bacterium]|uniref:Beta-propeller fold lactonase family protein n=1 Tax=Tectimicrobiota bacterium TaxID=2528274 RepID=A0A932ZV53_UNCTE|nr:beta-propeller fold lactonase family protein [Candidatus Tectomicrobia bacterium]
MACKRTRPKRLFPIALAAAAALALLAPGAPAAERVTLFVTSEFTDTVGVYKGEVPDLKRVKTIRVGRDPHNMGISPDGRWVVSGDRLAEQVSVIDTKSLDRVQVLKTGKHPHDVHFSPDGKLLFVGHERENFIHVFETVTWKRLAPIEVGAAQHDLSLSPDGRELWFTITNRPYRKWEARLGVVDLAAAERKVAWVFGTGNAHDAIFSPDNRTMWVTNGGFIGHAVPWVNVLDVRARRVLGTIKVGEYPFHSPKRGRDGYHVPLDAKEMWFSDHGTSSVIIMDVATMKPVGSVPVGKAPFHIAVTPGGVLFVANHDSHTVTVIDGKAKKALATLQVAKEPHGLAVLAGE